MTSVPKDTRQRYKFLWNLRYTSYDILLRNTIYRYRDAKRNLYHIVICETNYIVFTSVNISYRLFRYITKIKTLQ